MKLPDVMEATSTPEIMSPTMASLPIEILAQICENLCVHCVPQSGKQRCSDKECPKIGCRTLQNLCLVSKRVRSAALPVLLHQPENYMSLKKVLLFFCRYPQLGVHVRTLDLPLPTPPSVSEKSYLNQVAKTRITASSVGSNFSEIDRARLKYETLAAELLMLSAPNVEELCVRSLCSFYHSPVDDLECLTKLIREPSNKTGFKNIRQLSLTGEPSIGRLLQDQTFLALLNATTNLESIKLALTFNHYHQRQDSPLNFHPVLQKLKNLDISVSFACDHPPHHVFEDLYEVLKHTSSLEKFKIKITAMGEHGTFPGEIAPKGLILGLSPCAETLKHLKIEYIALSPRRDQVEGLELAEFIKLEMLDLSLNGFCQCDEEGPSGGDMISTIIDEIIATTLQRLTIRLGDTIDIFEIKDRDFIGCQKCIAAIGKKVAKGGAPALRYLEITHPEDQKKLIETYYKRANDRMTSAIEACRQTLEGTSVHLLFFGMFFTFFKDAEGSKMAWMNASKPVPRFIKDPKCSFSHVSNPNSLWTRGRARQTYSITSWNTQE